MIPELITLGAIAKFFTDIAKAVLSDKAKEWTRSDTPELKAKQAAFDLYQLLEGIVFQTQEFVVALEEVVRSAEAPNLVKEEEYWLRCTELHRILKQLLYQLQSLDQMIRFHFMPGLQIHKPEIIEAITKMRFDRAMPLPVPQDPVKETVESETYRREFEEEIKGTLPKLKERLNSAKANYSEIQNAAEELRKLLAQEYSFKESIK